MKSNVKKGISFVLAAMLLLGALPLVGTAAPGENPAHYSYVDIVKQVTDLEHFAKLPLPGERAGQFSSYDRASQYDAGADAYVNWGANGDGGGVLQNLGDVPGKGTQYLVADMQGPGVIWRIWSALANAGLIEIYIDGAATPTIAKPFNALFSGADSMFAYNALSYTAASGRNCIVPITYNQSCKIYLYGDWGAYYYFTYSTLPTGTTVESMPAALSDDQKAALTALNDRMKTKLGENPTSLSNATASVSADFTVPAGGSATVVDQPGAGALAQFKVKLNGDMTYAEAWRALKELTVSMYWDGQTAPSVWAPLGDFFGSPCGPSNYTTLPMGLSGDDWFYCYYYMPFEGGGRVVIGNDGAADRNISVNAAVVPLAASAASYTRFHAKWNKDARQPARADRWPDYTVLGTSGRGRYLGMSLHVYKTNDSVDPDSGAGGYWWGEGDEKFFVDGEKFPSIFGTGSEDYFGYAWCNPELFVNKPFHAQNYNQGGVHARGNRAVLRYHLADSVPFQTGFEGNIEKYYKNNTEYGVVSYWYLDKTGTDDYAPVSLEDRTKFYVVNESSEVLFEGEQMPYTVSTGGPWVQTMSNYSPYGWSNRQHLLWPGGAPGDALEYTFNLRQAAKGLLKISVTKSYDFGVFQFYLDGEKIGGLVDTYNPGVIVSEGIVLGQADLAKGEHKLKAVIADKNAKASGYLLGFDCFRIDPALPTAGILEAENMEVLYASGGNTPVQNMAVEWPSAGTYSGGKQLWWTTATEGSQSKNLKGSDELILAMDLPEDFDGELKMAFTKAGDYGKFQLAIDGVPLDGVVDLYHNGVVRSDLISLGRVKLNAGRHQLSVKCVGKNDASNFYMFALDCIVLQARRDDAVILGQIGSISGKQGTTFNVPVAVRSFSEASAMVMEGIIKLPAGVAVDDVVPTNAITYQTFDYSVGQDGTLRYVFLNTDGAPLKVTLDAGKDTEILTLKLRLAENKVKGDTFTVKAEKLVARSAGGSSFSYKTDGFESESLATIISTGEFSATPKELYAGDGVDFIPLGKKAVAIEFTGVDGTEDVTLFGKQLWHSSEKSSRTDKVTYVGLVDVDVTLAQMSDKGTYTVTGSAKTITFADTNGDGVINAQDALNILAVWLRKNGTPSEKDILIMNVSADSRIDIGDVIEIVDKYVNGAEFTVVTK